jgi:hypothetical protein
VTLVGAQSLTIAGEPGTYHFIFGNAEEQIAVLVVFDLVEGSLLLPVSSSSQKGCGVS